MLLNYKLRKINQIGGSDQNSFRKKLKKDFDDLVSNKNKVELQNLIKNALKDVIKEDDSGADTETTYYTNNAHLLNLTTKGKIYINFFIQNLYIAPKIPDNNTTFFYNSKKGFVDVIEKYKNELLHFLSYTCLQDPINIEFLKKIIKNYDDLKLILKNASKHDMGTGNFISHTRILVPEYFFKNIHSSRDIQDVEEIIELPIYNSEPNTMIQALNLLSKYYIYDIIKGRMEDKMIREATYNGMGIRGNAVQEVTDFFRDWKKREEKEKKEEKDIEVVAVQIEKEEIFKQEEKKEEEEKERVKEEERKEKEEEEKEDERTKQLYTSVTTAMENYYKIDLEKCGLPQPFKAGILDELEVDHKLYYLKGPFDKETGNINFTDSLLKGDFQKFKGEKLIVKCKKI